MGGGYFEVGFLREGRRVRESRLRSRRLEFVRDSVMRIIPLASHGDVVLTEVDVKSERQQDVNV